MEEARQDKSSLTWGWFQANDGITDSMDMSLSKFREIVKDRSVQLCGSLSILWHCLSLGLE